VWQVLHIATKHCACTNAVCTSQNGILNALNVEGIIPHKSHTLFMTTGELEQTRTALASASTRVSELEAHAAQNTLAHSAQLSQQVSEQQHKRAQEKEREEVQEVERQRVEDSEREKAREREALDSYTSTNGSFREDLVPEHSPMQSPAVSFGAADIAYAHELDVASHQTFLSYVQAQQAQTIKAELALLRHELQVNESCHTFE